MTRPRPLPGSRKPYNGPGQGMGIVDEEGAKWIAEVGAEDDDQEDGKRFGTRGQEPATQEWLRKRPRIVRFTPGPHCTKDTLAALRSVLATISPAIFETEILDA